MADTKVWGIHTTDDHLFLNNNLIAIGWHEMGDISDIQNDRELLKNRYPSIYPQSKPGSTPNACGQIFRFINEAQIDDYVVFPSKIDRKINIGQITGNPFYDANCGIYPRRRTVKWIKMEAL